jgi:hypothetical protein
MKDFDVIPVRQLPLVDNYDRGFREFNPRARGAQAPPQGLDVDAEAEYRAGWRDALREYAE